MTTIDRFDPFERRIADAIEQIADARRPDYLDNVLQLTARSRQRTRWVLPERWIKVNRFLIAAAAAMIIVATGAVLLISVRGPDTVGPGPTPTPTAPSQTPLVSGLGRGMGYATTAPSLFSSTTWVADTELIPAIGQTLPRLRLAVNASGRLLVQLNQPETVALVSTPVTGAPEELSLATSLDAQGCSTGDFGRYTITVSADRSAMQLEAISDQCSPRELALARTWTRSFDRESTGGRGVVGEFRPAFLVTLPESAYATNNGNQSANVFSDALGRTLTAVKNPTGWSDPCSDTGGSKIQMLHTFDAFIAHIDGLPGFSIGQQDYFKLDGHDAVRFVVPTTTTPECQKGGPNNGRVIEWGTANIDDPGFWMLAQGDTDVIYLVQVGNDLYLLQWLGDGVTSDEEMGVLTSVHFIDTLPITP